MTTEQFSVVERLGGDDFLARTLGRSFKVVRGDAASLAGLLSWDDLNAILTYHRFEAPRFRLATAGEQLPSHLYSRPVVTRRSTVWHQLQVSELHKQLADGATLVLDAVDELHPGIGMLYLPRGWWHAVAAPEGQHSLHVTCGLQSTTGADLITWLSEALRAHEAVRADIPRFGSGAEQRAFLDTIGRLVAAELESADLVTRFAAARDATERARLAPSLPYIAAAPPDPDLLVRLVTARASLTDGPQGTVRLVAGGEEWTFAAKAGPMLALLVGGVPRRLAELAQAAGITVPQAATVMTELVEGQVAAIGGAG